MLLLNCCCVFFFTAVTVWFSYINFVNTILGCEFFFSYDTRSNTSIWFSLSQIPVLSAVFLRLGPEPCLCQKEMTFKGELSAFIIRSACQIRVRHIYMSWMNPYLSTRCILVVYMCRDVCNGVRITCL